MKLSDKFVCAGERVCSFEQHVNAPCFRKSFILNSVSEKAEITVCGLGFYELYINGKNITKGPLAPYISNPDDIIYYDNYDVAPYLKKGKNVIGIMLGNGFFNPFGGAIWNLEKAPWIGPVRFALYFEADCGREHICFEADADFKTHDSAVTFDEYRMGIHYDARLEQKGWSEPGFDDSAWTPAVLTDAPHGDMLLCQTDPIVVTKELKPVSITKSKRGYIYDFGLNLAGVCRLCIKGRAGQRISLWHADMLEDGELDITTTIFDRPGFEYYKEYSQRDIYTCKGEGKEVFVPKFTYHGFQYVLVEGIEEEQATESLLTYLVMNSDVSERGGFSCSDKVVNTLQKFVRNSDLSNFYYFPTDCPHREKHGWTGDASLSAEHMLLNLRVENSLREWMRNVRKAQKPSGELPGIVPTAGWGLEWGNGPGWDNVCVNIPYYVYKYTGDNAILHENADMIFKNLKYMQTHIEENGLISYGLSDWCQPVKYVPPEKEWETDHDLYSSPRELVDTAMILDMCKKAAFVFDKTNRKTEKKFAEDMHSELLRAIRENLLDKENVLLAGNCQTSQAFGLAFDIFTEEERPKAYENLVKIVHGDGDFLNSGVLGLRQVFRMLAEGGDIDLALKMITRPEWPSYGHWLAQGATSMWEYFVRDYNFKTYSRNHQFHGDISALFISYIAGLKPNPSAGNIDEVEVSPCFASNLQHAEAHFDAPKGRVEVSWKREGKKLQLSVVLPQGMFGTIRLPKGYSFENGGASCEVKTGKYTIVC